MRERVPSDVLKARVEAVERWLARHGRAVEEQLHLDHDTRECAYWHAGYRQALGDVLGLMAADHLASREDTASPSRPAAPDAGHCRSA